MSNALAVAGVSAVLRDLLNDGLVTHNVSGVLGTTVTVTNLPPDRIVNGSPETTQLNLFLRQISPNIGWRNEALPSRDGAGRTRLSNQPLALNLHYLVAAYGAEDLHAEFLLGYAMQLLHENPVISRQAIRNALQPGSGPPPSPALEALAESGLPDQAEQLRIVPEFLSTDEVSNFWNATKSHFRPSAAYRISVVLIEVNDPVRAPLPVLSRQGSVRPDLLPHGPTLMAIIPDAGQPVAQFETTISLQGINLDGSAREIRLVNDRFDIEENIPTAAGNQPTVAQFQLTAAHAQDLPAGVYRGALRLVRPGETAPRVTNELAVVLAPVLKNLPASPLTRDVTGGVNFSVEFLPALQPGQTASLILGQRECVPDEYQPPTTTLDFSVPDAPAGIHLVRLRIDGIDSPIVDRTANPPAFLDHRIEIQ